MIKPNYKHILQFGEEVFLEGLEQYKSYTTLDYKTEKTKLIRIKRLAVVTCIHGVELILKAILIKKGYNIYKITNKEIFKSNVDVKELVNEDRTVELSSVLDFFKREHGDLDINPLKQLNKLRNQIVHLGYKVDSKKKEYFVKTIAYLNDLYVKERIKRKFITQINEFKGLIESHVEFYPE